MWKNSTMKAAFESTIDPFIRKPHTPNGINPTTLAFLVSIYHPKESIVSKMQITIFYAPILLLVAAGLASAKPLEAAKLQARTCPITCASDEQCCIGNTAVCCKKEPIQYCIQSSSGAPRCYNPPTPALARS
ncbi:hypothetical protein DFH27DRAFT_598637 [Peziza echinospora]|nr:hypothetical protein DFH27DRAFT_598637 [Peziza echinospora]